MSNYMAKAMDSGNKNAIKSMHTSFPAIVVSYDEALHLAVVQPLYKLETGESYPQIQNVPVAKWRYKIMKAKAATATVKDHKHSINGTTEAASGPSSHSHNYIDETQDAGGHSHGMPVEEVIEEIKLLLAPGDLVLCVCCEKSIDSMASKKVHTPQSKRIFDISDAIIVCLL